MPNVTILQGDAITFREDRCNEAVTPGHLLEFNANDRLQRHASSGGAAARMFAVESGFIGNDTRTAYVSGDRVPYADCAPGVIVWAHLASGQNVARGDFLQSDGAGRLTAQTGTNVRVANADEDANATVAGTGVNGIRFRARVV